MIQKSLPVHLEKGITPNKNKIKIIKYLENHQRENEDPYSSSYILLARCKEIQGALLTHNSNREMKNVICFCMANGLFISFY